MTDKTKDGFTIGEELPFIYSEEDIINLIIRDLGKKGKIPQEGLPYFEPLKEGFLIRIEVTKPKEQAEYERLKKKYDVGPAL